MTSSFSRIRSYAIMGHVSARFSMLPTVKFIIDQAKDLDVLHGFLRDARFDGGRNLEWAVYGKHPELKDLMDEGLTREGAESVKKYVNRFFSWHLDQINSNMSEYRKMWETKQESYSHLVSNIFQERIWPKGEYIAYATVWGMFPRNLDNKTFQVPAIYDNKPYVNVIVAHEMLHFMFYDFLFEKHPELNNKEDNFLTWNVSEIFNSVVQNSALWLDTFQVKTMTYPEHNKVETELREKYPEVTYKNIDQLMEEIIGTSRVLVIERQSH